MSFRAIQQIRSNSGATTGYRLIDDRIGKIFEMDNKKIKANILSKKMDVYNLKVTVDGKLIHIPKFDKIGVTVPPEQFFSGRVGDWILTHSNSGQCFKAQHISGKSFILNYSFEVQGRRYRLILQNDPAVIRNEMYSEDFYRDINWDTGNTIDDFIKALNKLLTRKVTSEEDAKLQQTSRDLLNYIDLSRNKKNLEDEYNHGCSEDAEDAAYDLRRLEELEHTVSNNREYQEILDKLQDLTPREQEEYLLNYAKGVVRKINKKKASKAVPSPYPGIIYETSNRTRSQFLNSLSSSNGIHAYNSMEYWWSLDAEEREKEIHDPNSPWYNFEG